KSLFPGLIESLFLGFACDDILVASASGPPQPPCSSSAALKPAGPLAVAAPRSGLSSRRQAVAPQTAPSAAIDAHRARSGKNSLRFLNAMARRPGEVAITQVLP